MATGSRVFRDILLCFQKSVCVVSVFIIGVFVCCVQTPCKRPQRSPFRLAPASRTTTQDPFALWEEKKKNLSRKECEKKNGKKIHSLRKQAQREKRPNLIRTPKQKRHKTFTQNTLRNKKCSCSHVCTKALEETDDCHPHQVHLLSHIIIDYTSSCLLDIHVF